MPDDFILRRKLEEAVAHHRAGQFQQAQTLYERIVASHPLNCDALYFLGVLHFQQGRNEQGISYFDRALSACPKYVAAWNNRGIALCNLNQFAEGVRSFDGALSIDPGNAEIWNNRGAAFQSLKNFDEALASFGRAITLKRDYAEAFNNRGATFRHLGRLDEALVNCRRALELRKNHPTALNNLGMILCDLKRYEEALSCFDGLVAIVPDYAEAWNNRGNVLWEMGHFADAMASYGKALELNPNYPEALFNRGNTYWTEYRDYRSAEKDLEKVLRLAPSYEYAVGGLLHLRMHVGDWKGFEAQLSLVNEGVKTGRKAIEPFAYMALSGSPSDLKLCTSIQTLDGYPNAYRPWPARSRSRKKLRLGYVSGEFREQATAYLTAGLYEAHDKDQFELFGFDNGFSDRGPTRARLERAFDEIVDISKMNDDDAAKAMFENEIDILVNMNGYFGKHRMGVFAQRPAALQINYLGYPGTLGADYMDYIVADRILIREEEQRFYSEAIVWLPDTYQVNDSQRAEVGSTTRAEHGLPDDVFVFCSFNQSYKLTPTVFEVWMRILKRVDNSVLWILESNKDFARHLSQAASQHGVDSNRLIFAPVIDADHHLARMALGDLFLDTLPCNAHTTASDALWAGLPLITCRGETFAGRVATSILSAMDLTELVTENLPDYEALAVELALNRAALSGIRDKIKRNKTISALFDTARYTRNLEFAYRKMWNVHEGGGRPQSFFVAR